MCEYRSGKLPCAMKVTVVGPFGALSAGHNPSGERSECEHTCWDPKGEKNELVVFYFMKRFGILSSVTNIISPSSSVSSLLQ